MPGKIQYDPTASMTQFLIGAQLFPSRQMINPIAIQILVMNRGEIVQGLQRHLIRNYFSHNVLYQFHLLNMNCAAILIHWICVGSHGKEPRNSWLLIVIPPCPADQDGLPMVIFRRRNWYHHDKRQLSDKNKQNSGPRTHYPPG